LSVAAAGEGGMAGLVSKAGLPEKRWTQIIVTITISI
jgi:hypothetical protein